MAVSSPACIAIVCLFDGGKFKMQHLKSKKENNHK